MVVKGGVIKAVTVANLCRELARLIKRAPDTAEYTARKLADILARPPSAEARALFEQSGETT